MQARQALFSSAPSAENLKIYTDFLTHCQQLVKKVQTQDSNQEPHNPPVVAMENVKHISSSGGLKAYVQHGLRFLGLTTFASFIHAQDSSIIPGSPPGVENECKPHYQACVQAYTANATQTLAQFFLVSSNVNRSTVTNAMKEVSSCFAESEQALLDIIQDIISYVREYYQPGAPNCIHGPHAAYNPDNPEKGNLFAIGFATNISKEACWEFTKAIAARAESCIVSTQCPAPVSTPNIVAITLSSVLMAVAGVATTLTFMKYYNARKEYKNVQEAQHQLSERFI